MNNEDLCFISLYNSSIFHLYDGLGAFTTPELESHELYAKIKDLFS
jgi:hypothetical protein